MKHPATTECATCGGVAERIAYLVTCSWAYNCRDCHAGGEITSKGDRKGGVFERLENESTRQLEANTGVVDGQPVATDGAGDARTTSWDAAGGAAERLEGER